MTDFHRYGDYFAAALIPMIFDFPPAHDFSLIFSLAAQKTRTSAGTDPLKTKIVFMLCYQYSRIGQENQS